MKYTLNWKEYAETIREVVREGVVLLKNDNNALPIRQGERVSIFGRIQLNYYDSGTGSGGMVNNPYSVSIVDGLRNSEVCTVNEELFSQYKEWEKEHPFDNGVGWARQPFYQEEMPLTREQIEEARSKSDVGIVIIGRLAGEDRDAVPEKGSYLLTEDEERLIYMVSSVFERSIVLLNVGSIMDMKWVLKYNPSAVMYVWQGGQEGGNGIADVLCGKYSPSGRLVDTIAFDIKDYPSWHNFGSKKENIYTEDIYVGYRYFETVARESAMYPFGSGISYTTFDIDLLRFEAVEDSVRIFLYVTNTGQYAGKEVVQIYYKPPCVHLGKPERNLIRFGKTRLLQPGESEKIAVVINMDELASYDDTGLTGHKSCYILEQGSYEFYVGKNVRDVFFAGKKECSDQIVTMQLKEALSPRKIFTRMVYDGRYMTYEPVLLSQVKIEERIAANRPEAIEYTGDKGYKLTDVLSDKVSMKEFIAQLSDKDLIEIGRMEGMCSPKVTAGTAGAIGGVTESLRGYGIPIVACSDGPAGIRRDDGSMAFLLPCGTMLACSFNTALVEKLFIYEGKELRLNRITSLLGPGMNIHRNPLCGRNFEYFSEDPYLTGCMGVAVLNGLHKTGVFGTIKHFCGNNQELARHDADTVVSERALREIYLKGFEMAVKQAGVKNIMSTYGPVNGVWTSSNYDLLTTILREQWGFDGLVMTDWWAKGNDELDLSVEGAISQAGPMVRAQNDLYAVASSAEENSNNDNREQWLKEGRITRGELQRNAMNICKFLLRAYETIEIATGEKDEWEEIDRPESDDSNRFDLGKINISPEAETILPIEGFTTAAGSANCYQMIFAKKGNYRIIMRMRSLVSGLAQANGIININKTPFTPFALTGADTEWLDKELELPISVSVENYVEFYFSQSGIEVESIKVLPPL